RSAQSQCRRARADPCEQVQRGRDLTESREVVLDEERADEAERLGFDVELDKIPEPGAAVGVGTATLGLGAAEDSKSHAMTSLRMLTLLECSHGSVRCHQNLTVALTSLSVGQRRLDLLDRIDLLDRRRQHAFRDLLAQIRVDLSNLIERP